MDEDLPELRTLAQLAEHVRPGVFVRFSRGPAVDRDRCSRDYESGLELPGLSVNPLQPEPWWTRPVKEWLARQLCNYVHLADEADDERRAWILEGEVVARGPDNEPLVTGVRPLAWLSAGLVEEAKRLYAERFDVAEDST
ncbi:MAG TPA: DUF6098 family protein [Egibacteraceae bacterium]|jgi:hypothetical protein|nr:DUF6098 family protein [Egibacteraceae bacterium]